MSGTRAAVAASMLFTAATFSVTVSGAPLPHKEMKEVLSAFEALGPKPIETLTPQEARKQPTPADAVKSVLQKKRQSTKPEAVAKVEDREIKTAAGEIPIRIYWPSGAKAEGLPVVHYIHGGGWVIADLDVYDASPRAIANAAKAIVVSSHYRQAPEHKFPAAHEDSFAAYQWVLANAKALGGDPQAIAVMGESAGGNMAAAITMMAKQKGVQMPVHQVLGLPGRELRLRHRLLPGKRGRQAARQGGHAVVLQALPARRRRTATTRCCRSSKRTMSSGLPPATVITAAIDPLRSDGKAYADKLKEAGVKVDYRNYEGVTHEFFGMGAVVPEAKLAVKQAADGLRGGFQSVVRGDDSKQSGAAGASRK